MTGMDEGLIFNGIIETDEGDTEESFKDFIKKDKEINFTESIG